MNLLGLGRTLFGSVEFGSDFLIEVVVFVLLLQFFQIVVDLMKGRTF